MPPDNSVTAAEREERLKSALWYVIGTYVDSTAFDYPASQGSSANFTTLNATPHFIGALTELVYTQIANTARDIETFAHHAGRKVVCMEDVLLLTRRNDALEIILRKEVEKTRVEDEGKKQKHGIGRNKVDRQRNLDS